MAVVVSNVTSGSGTTTASITTITGQLYFARLLKSTTGTPTITNGLGLTWTQIGTTLTYTTSLVSSLWYAICTAGATGTLTISASTIYIIDTVTGASSTPIVQTISKGDSSGATSSTLTMAAFSGVANATYSAWGTIGSGTITIVAKSGWTDVKPSFSPFTLVSESQYITSNDTAPYASFTGGTPVFVAGYGVEIQSATPSLTIANSLLMLGCGS